MTIEDPAPPWQISCTGPKPLTYHLRVTTRHPEPRRRGEFADEVTVSATCEDLAGRTEYTFTGHVPLGVLY